jgi:hypothetical protein
MKLRLNPPPRAAALAALSLAFAGCAENRYCADPLPYEKAPSVPAIQSVGDMKVAPAADAYAIPPPPANPIAFGIQAPDPKKPGKNRWICLDQPPALVNTGLGNSSTTTTGTTPPTAPSASPAPVSQPPSTETAPAPAPDSKPASTTPPKS